MDAEIYCTNRASVCRYSAHRMMNKTGRKIDATGTCNCWEGRFGEKDLMKIELRKEEKRSC